MTESLLPTQNSLNEPTEPQFEDNKSYLEELIGPGGKFHDPDRNKALEKLARGKLHSDHYIPVLERRMDQMRTDNEGMNKQLLAGQRLQELIDKMAAMQTTNSNNEEPPVNENQGRPAVDMNEIQSLVSRQIQEDRIAREQANNLNYVKNKLAERYGPNYGAQLDKQYRELGLSPETADQMARTTPKAFERMLGLDKPVETAGFQAPPQNQGRVDRLGNNQEPKTWSYYQDLKKRDPKTYYSKKTAAQMEQDYATLGHAFEDGDFYS